MIGKVLGNRYEIVEKVGGGGMSVVYKAKCNVLNRYVAIKVLRHELTSDPDFVEKFKQESLSAASLTHPNIVNIYDTGIEDDIYYIVMEYVKGETLKDYIKRKGSLTEQETINIARQIAEALKHAHSNKIVHRDIKPHNILLTEEGIVKVADFGIARASSSSTINNTSNVIGSVHYFSPEQARGGYVDEKSDIYSLGIVMYEMITGVVPFDADNHITVAMKQIQEKPIPPSKKVGNVKISNALEEIIMKCLEKYQSYRFQNIEELLISLNAINGYSRINMGINDADDLDSPTIIIPKVENNEDPLNEKIIDINILDENSDKAFKTFFGEYDNGEIDGKDEEDKKWRKKSKKKNKGNNEKPEKDINENEDDHKKNLKMTIIAILSALVVAIMGGIIGFRAFFYQPEIPVPDIRGKNEEEAKKIIEELGLVFEVENREYNNEFDKGEIIQQSVEEGKKVKKDFPIKVTVSMGNKEIKVPKLIGKYSIEAPVILSEMGLLPGDDIKEVYDDTAPAGQIIDQYPAENNPAKEGDKVNYTVSLGPETSYVIVPKLVGFSLNEALAKITQSGLVSKIEEKYSDEVTEGIVMNQSIASGQEVEEGSSVTLTVSKGPEETNTPDGEGEPSTPENPSTKTFPLTITLPTDRETVLVVVQKVTEEGREIVYSQEVNTSDQSIIVNVKGTGTQVFEIYTDNVLYDKTEITFD